MEDEKIIALFNERSEQGIHELSKKYGALCRKIAVNILNDSSDAEECLNDAYLGVWNAIPPARPENLCGYLCRIVRNLSLKQYYKNNAKKRNSEFDVAISEIENTLASPDTVESALEAENLTGILEEFLDSLSCENRVIFMRRYWFSDSYAEISQRMNISEKTVSVRLVRIRKKLKQYLEEKEVYL